MYEVLVTFLDAILSPQDYPELISQEGSWNWNSDTKTKAQGLKNSLTSFQTIATFIITKIASKLQKCEQDVYEAYTMVNTVIENIDTSRKNIDMVFSSWYEEVLTLANKVGVAEFVPRKTSLQRNRSNTPRVS